MILLVQVQLKDNYIKRLEIITKLHVMSDVLNQYNTSHHEQNQIKLKY